MTEEELEKLGLAVAGKAHDNETDFGRAATLAAVSVGTETLKAVLVINGGACVAMLAFIGTFASQGKMMPGMAGPLIWFAVGACLTVVAASFGYLTNLSYASESNRKSRHFDAPYVRETDESRRHHAAAAVYRVITIGCIVLGILAFVGGVFAANCMFGSLPIKQQAASPSAITPSVK